MPEQRIRNGPPPPPPPPPTDPYSGPDYQGFVFVLVSSVGKSNHILTIGMQVNEKLYDVAYISGLWYAEGDPSQAKSIEGAILDNGGAIKASWSPPNTTGQTNVLTGSLTYYPGGFGNITFIRPWAYLAGEVTAYDDQGNVLQGKGPGPVSGTGTTPWVNAL
jgi:hypothetical protein